jgi:hypothetical protein
MRRYASQRVAHLIRVVVCTGREQRVCCARCCEGIRAGDLAILYCVPVWLHGPDLHKHTSNLPPSFPLPLSTPL